MPTAITPEVIESTVLSTATVRALDCLLARLSEAPPLLYSGRPSGPGLAFRLSPQGKTLPALNLWLPLGGAAGTVYMVWDEHPGEIQLETLPPFVHAEALRAWLETALEGMG